MYFLILAVASISICPVFTFICEESQSHCETSLNIGYRFTMIDEEVGQVIIKNGKLYSRQNETNQIPLINVITADGWDTNREIIVANGSMPGPDIVIHENQKITIVVHNKLFHEAVTIHWHGIDQLGWPYMDGVSFVTQCPILPGQSFNYTFQPTFGGTYWYHSHVGGQRDMGLFGAFIVLRGRDTVEFSQQYILQLQEWNHLFDTVATMKINNIDKKPHSILINGRGHFEDNTAPISVFYLEQQKRYRFRLIGVGAQYPLLFSVSEHKLTVIETDGYEIEPIDVDKIIINPAERYDVMLNLTNTKPGVYNITANLLTGSRLEILNISGLAYLNVTSEDVNVNDNINKDVEEIKILNCPFPEYPYQNNVKCIPVSDLKSDGDEPDLRFQTQIKPVSYRQREKHVTHFLNFGIPNGVSSVNGRQFILPDVSSISQPSEIGNPCIDCGDERICKCSHSLDLEHGSIVTMVLLNLGKGAFISHPIHMHGHSYKVLKMGLPKLSSDGKLIHNNDIQCSDTLLNNESYCNTASWRDPSWNDNIPNINTINPVRKDTVIVPVGGYVVIRINASNPGLWFMHCHIDVHMIEGMALMLNESFDELQKHLEVPPNFPRCQSFHNKDISLTGQKTSVAFNTEVSGSSVSAATIVLAVIVGLLLIVVIIVCLLYCRRKRSTDGYHTATRTQDVPLEHLTS